MTVLSDLKLDKNPSNDELVTKFNIVVERTNINSNRIEKAIITNEDFYVRFEKRMDLMENNLSRKIDKQEQHFNKEISEIKHKEEIDDVKEESSFKNMFNISTRNAILKALEYGILMLLFFGVSTIFKK